MKDAIKSANTTGAVMIDINTACEKFKRKRFRKGTSRICSETFISKWHDEYRLVDISNSSVCLKVTISTAAANEIIDRLDLVRERSMTFRHASTFTLR